MSASFRLRTLAAAMVGLTASACGPQEAATTLPTDPTPAVVELSITPAGATLAYLGATTQLKATLKNTLGRSVTAPRIFWESLEPAVATVDTTGMVTGVTVGSARVRAQFLELADTVEVTVARVPTSMDISLDSILFTELGRTADVAVTVRDGSGLPIPEPQVIWTSQEPAVASVTAPGKVKSVNDGTTLITARSDTVSRTVKVRVASRPASMTVTPAAVAMDGVSDTARIVTVLRNAAGVPMYPVVPTYTSSDTTVVKVDVIGFLIARKKGSATITVKADTLTRNVPVTVTQTIQSVRIVPDTASVSVGGTKAYAALVKDRYGIAVAGATVAWTSSDPAVATVSATGVVTGVALGSAVLTATSGAKSDTASVTVR
ncbi:MAG: hypothetical protein AMXMBFR53_36930 [Gemmatimonadota bacterium]